MKLFASYIKTKSKIILMLLAFSVILFLSFVFFRLPLTAFIYPCALCMLCGMLFAVSDFRSFKRTHGKLLQMLEGSSYLVCDICEKGLLPDDDYIKIIACLKEMLLKTETAASLKYSNMTEYYTAWAHQIKTPIASMKLTLQNEDTQMSRKLSAELFRIEQYVEMVLAFLRLDSETTDYLFKEYELDKIIKDSVKKFASDFINKKLCLKYEETGIRFVTDEKWFSFVFEQIISNAIKYTREGGISIYADGEKLYIEDSGIGISPQDIPRIFEKGYTGINGRADKSASGIGLYLSKRVCENLGVGISVTSSQKGTTVCLDLEQYKQKKE